MKWFEYDDDQISDAEETTLVKPTTYMLFYYNKSLEKYPRANPPAVSAAHKKSQKPTKQVYESTKPPIDDYEIRKLGIKKPKATMPDAYDSRYRNDPGYDAISVDSHRGFYPRGEHDPRIGYEEERGRGDPIDVNSYTAKPFEDRLTSNSSEVIHTNIILRREDLNDYEQPRYQPPSALFGVVEQPTVSRARRQQPRGRGESSYHERYL
jgi:hypothetical protein